MAELIQRTRDTNDVAIISSAIALNTSTSTILSGAFVRRIFFAVSNSSNKDIWLKLQAASVDNDKKGIFVPRNSYWEMQQDNIYIGEISAIANIGAPDIYITEY